MRILPALEDDEYDLPYWELFILEQYVLRVGSRLTWSYTSNSPDSFLNGFTRLSGLIVLGSSYFSKVSSTPDFDNKILSTAESGFDAQNLLKFCPEYCY